jgi:hypothetical protein
LFFFRSYSQDDSSQIHIPVVPTPPSSPHIEFLRQQYYFHPATYNYLMAQQYRILIDQQQQYGYTIVDGNVVVFFCFKRNLNDLFFFSDKQKQTDLTIDEHFRKSLGDNHNKFPGRCLTPDDSSSNGSSIERTSGL